MDSQITVLKLRGWSGLTNNYVKTERLARTPGFSNLAGARRKSPATSSICVGYFSYPNFINFTKVIVN